MFNDWSKRMPTIFSIGEAVPQNEVKNDAYNSCSHKVADLFFYQI